MAKWMTDTELKPVLPESPQCQAINSSGNRCKSPATWNGIYQSNDYVAGVKQIKIYLCDKHAKMVGWPVGTSLADDKE